jgi:tetratricopeptide (TPR) repeat protein/TolB-like protein
MPGKPYILNRFWQEIKRRRVFRVVATYLATGYIILEVTNNLVGPLHLPAWTATLIILLLAAGLPVTLVITWIFDFTPAGIIRTEPAAAVPQKSPEKGFFKRIFSANNIVITILLIVAGALAWPRIFGSNKPVKTLYPDKPVTVAVMPFQNMTNDTLWNGWQNGIQVNLITSLSNTGEIEVKELESVNSSLRKSGIRNYASLTTSVEATAARKLKANTFVCGSIKQAGSTIRINAQLVNSGTEDSFRSFQLDGTRKAVLSMIDSLTSLVRNSLIISKLEREASMAFQGLAMTNSPEAYRYFSFGNIAFQKYDYPTAAKWFSQACLIDTNLVFSSILLSLSYANEGLYNEGKKLIIKLYGKKDQLPLQLKPWINYAHAVSFETPEEEIRYLKQLKESKDQAPVLYSFSGYALNRLEQFEKAIPELEKALEMYKKWKIKPFWSKEYVELGLAYHKTGIYDSEKKLYRTSSKYFPEDLQLLRREALLALAENDSASAEKYIQKFKKASVRNLIPEPAINASVGDIYYEAGMPGMAEIFYRQALSYEPDNPGWLNNLAWLLIEKNRDVSEGLQLVDRALGSDPSNYLYLDCKGWGLYRQGKYREALDLLEKSRDLSPVYRHQLLVHIEEVKKALAAQKVSP